MIFIYRSDQRIGVDLHGVIDHNVPLFKELMSNFIQLGKEVWVISGPPKDEIEAELAKHEVKKGEHYHLISSNVDYLREQGIRMWLDDKKTWWCDDEPWWASKGNICKENGITILIDDQIKYNTGMPKDGSIRLLIYDRRGVITQYKEDTNERK